MANRKKTGNIVSMKRRRSKTLGVILCLFSLYLLVMFIMSMTKDHLSIYEVNETQIADDETIRGLILRDEVLVNTQKAGYINYYVGEGDRVGLRTNVYSVDGTGDIAQKLSEMDTGSVELSAQDTREIRDSILIFVKILRCLPITKYQIFAMILIIPCCSFQPLISNLDCRS